MGEKLPAAAPETQGARPPPVALGPLPRFSHEVSLRGRRRALGIVRLVVFIVSRTWPGCARRWGGGGSRAPGPAAGRPRRVGGGGQQRVVAPFLCRAGEGPLSAAPPHPPRLSEGRAARPRPALGSVRSGGGGFVGKVG